MRLWTAEERTGLYVSITNSMGMQKPMQVVANQTYTNENKPVVTGYMSVIDLVAQASSGTGKVWLFEATRGRIDQKSHLVYDCYSANFLACYNLLSIVDQVVDMIDDDMLSYSQHTKGLKFGSSASNALNLLNSEVLTLDQLSCLIFHAEKAIAEEEGARVSGKIRNKWNEKMTTWIIATASIEEQEEKVINAHEFALLIDAKFDADKLAA